MPFRRLADAPSALRPQVDESHEGQYSCTPYNALGSAGASPRVRVRVLRPPALAARPQPLYVARLGATLTLPCALQASSQEGDAAPPLLWTRVRAVPTACLPLTCPSQPPLFPAEGWRRASGRTALDRRG